MRAFCGSFSILKGKTAKRVKESNSCSSVERFEELHQTQRIIFQPLASQQRERSVCVCVSGKHVGEVCRTVNPLALPQSLPPAPHHLLWVSGCCRFSSIFSSWISVFVDLVCWFFDHSTPLLSFSHSDPFPYLPSTHFSFTSSSPPLHLLSVFWFFCSTSFLSLPALSLFKQHQVPIVVLLLNFTCPVCLLVLWGYF